MHNLRRHRLSVAWLVVLALLGNAVLAALCAAPAKRASAVDGILGPLVICTSHGADASAPDGAPSPLLPTEHCPACALLAKVAVIPAPLLVSEVAAQDAASLRPMPPQARRLAEHLGPGHVRSRAPPNVHLA